MTELITTAQAAQLAGCHRRTVLRAIRRGDLPATQLSNRWHIKRSDLDRWNGTRQTRGGRPTSEFDEYVHEHSGRWVVARYRDGRYYAPMTAESRRLSGCSAVFGPLGYVISNAYHYKHRQHALTKARELFS